MKNPVVVVGSCMMDFVCYSSRLPKEGETLHGYKFVINFGGKGANQCVAAHNLGGDTTMIARVGDDLWGDKYIQNFLDTGINCHYVKKTPKYSNGIAQITVADSGENQIIIVAGANSQLSVEDIQSAKTVIENAGVVVCQLETSSAVAIEALRLCNGVSILNGAPALDVYDLELITLPSIFCVNELEASVFAGMPITTLSEAKSAVSLLLEKGCKCVIITMGAQGAVFATQAESVPLHVEAPKIECIDSTGAGDAFVGCLAYLLANYREMLLKDSIAISCFIASESCKKPGTQCSFPNVDVLKVFMQQNYPLYF